MKVKLKRDWRTLAAGRELDVPAGQAEVMVGRGVAEYLDEQVSHAPVDRMMRPASRSSRQKAQA